MSKRLHYAEINDLAEREDAFHLPHRRLQDSAPRQRFQAARGARDEAAGRRPTRPRPQRIPRAD